MRKEELRKLRSLPATKEMMQKGKRYIEKTERHWYTGKTQKVMVNEYDVLLRVQKLGDYIKIAVFLPEDMRKDIKTPRYEIFLNVEGEEYITRELDDEGRESRWLTSMISNLPEIAYYSWYHIDSVKAKAFINAAAMKTINSLPLEHDNENYKGLKRINKWQKEQYAKRIKRKELKEQAPWDADMKLIPDILPGFKHWATHDATNEHYIFYTYERKGAKEGYCSYCDKYVPIINPKHNKVTICPCCKKNVTFKADSRIQRLERNEYFAECIQKIKDGFVIRNFRVNCNYRNTTPENPRIYLSEEERYLVFKNGKVKHYSWEWYKRQKMRWVFSNNGYYSSYWRDKRTRLYTRNLKSLKKGVLKTSAIDLWDKLPCSSSEYLYAEGRNPAIEKLARIGMFKQAEEMIDTSASSLINIKETELYKMLKIDKARFKRWKKMRGNIRTLQWLQHEKLADTVWSDEMIKNFVKADFHPVKSFEFINMPLHYKKIWNYLKKQSVLSKDTIRQVQVTWRDYVNMAKKANWNVTTDQILYPKNLKEAHGKVILCLQGESMKKQAEDLEKKWPKVNAVLPGIKKFEYASGKYMIVTPDEILDIVKEGTALSHCVHTCDFYFDRIQKHETYLFFLRKAEAPDVPWYTLEVEPSGNIRQKRTTGDNQNKDFEEAVEFLKEWQKVFVSRLTKEEKKLGILADKARIEEYKKLRKDGNKVWHGKLAGKLLVDVLEADFMAAGM